MCLRLLLFYYICIVVIVAKFWRFSRQCSGGKQQPVAVLGAGCAHCRGGEIRGDSVRFFSGPDDDSGGGDGGAQPLPILPARPSIGLLGRSAAPVVALFRERLESN